MGMSAIVGGNLKMGIQMFLDARQVVNGAKEAESALQKVQITAASTNNAINKSARSLSSSLQGIGAAMTMVGYAAQAAGKAVIGGFIQPSYREAVKYEDALAGMRTVLRYTKEEMLDVRKVIEANAMGSMFTFTEVAEAATRLAAFTGEANKLGEQLPTLMKFVTTVGKALDPEEASRTMSGFYVKWRATGITFEQMGNQLIKLANVTAVEFRDLPQILRSSRDIAASVNIKFEEFGALIGILREGLSPAEAARSAAGFARALNTATGAMKEYANKRGVTFEKAMELGKTDKKAKQLVQAVSTLGVNFFTTTGKAKEFTTVIEESLAAASALKKKGDMREYQRVMLRVFKDQAKNVMSALDAYERGGKKASDGFKSLAKELASSQGYLNWAAKVMGEAPGNIERKWEASVTRFRTKFGEPLMAIFIPILDKLADFMDKLTIFASENPRIAQAIGILTVAFAGLLVVGGTLTALFGGIALWLSFILPALTATGAGAAASAFKFGSLAARLGVVAKYLGPTGILLTGFMAFRNFFGKNTELDKIINKFKNFGLVLQGVGEWMGGKETKGSRSLYRKLKTAGLLGTVELFLQIGKRITTFFKSIYQGIQPALIAIGAAVNGLLVPIRLLLDGVGWLFKTFAGGRKDLNDQLSYWRNLGRLIGWFVGTYLVALVAGWAKAGVAALAFGTKLTLAAGVWGAIIVAALALASILGQEKTWSGIFDVVADIQIYWNDLITWFVNAWGKALLEIQRLVPTWMGGVSEEEYAKRSAALAKPKYLSDNMDLARKMYKDAPFLSEQAMSDRRQQYEASVYERETGSRAPGVFGTEGRPYQRIARPALSESYAAVTPGGKEAYPWKPGSGPEIQKPRQSVVVNIDARGSVGLDTKNAKEAIVKVVKDGIEKSQQVKYGSSK